MSRQFHRSRFIELLSDAHLAPVNARRLDFAERLSLWLTPADAIQLHGLLQNTPAPSVATALSTRQAVVVALNKSVQHTRTQLTQHITRADDALARVAEGATLNHAPFRKRHFDLQRQMDTHIAPMRASVRQVLSKISPRLRHLAALDAAMEQALASREQKLLAAAPLLLEKRFDAMKHKVQAGADTPPTARHPAPWLVNFDREWQAHLLAELDLRLQPVMGLVEALSQEGGAHA